MALLRLCGDLHGDFNAINQIKQSLDKYDLTIQLGDFGAGFGAESALRNIDSDKLKILLGNHDSWSILSQFPHSLSRYGILEFAGQKIFYVGGAWSIDQAYRTEGLSWWRDEELSYKECSDCVDLWEANCSDCEIFISHDAPINVCEAILGSWPTENTTNKLLWEIWKIKEPKQHFFGHWHRSFQKKIGNTEFRCLNINEEVILEL